MSSGSTSRWTRISSSAGCGAGSSIDDAVSLPVPAGVNISPNCVKARIAAETPSEHAQAAIPCSIRWIMFLNCTATVLGAQHYNRESRLQKPFWGCVASSTPTLRQLLQRHSTQAMRCGACGQYGHSSRGTARCSHKSNQKTSELYLVIMETRHSHNCHHLQGSVPD